MARQPGQLHPAILRAHWKGDYRARCDDCGGLVCRGCGACSGDHYWDGGNWRPEGKITTDSAGNTMHASCREEAAW